MTQEATQNRTHLSGGALLARMMSFALPSRRVLSVERYPRVYFPLFITRASLVLMLSIAFFWGDNKEYTHSHYTTVASTHSVLKYYLPTTPHDMFLGTETLYPKSVHQHPFNCKETVMELSTTLLVDLYCAGKMTQHCKQ